MPAKTPDKALQKIDRDLEKTRELLERELEREREQAEAARTGVEEARTKLEDIEGRRPALASDVFSGEKEYEDLDALDSEIARLRRHAEVAEIAQEQAAARAPAIEERIEGAATEAAAKRYDVLASERKERAVELDSTLDALTSQVDALLELDNR